MNTRPVGPADALAVSIEDAKLNMRIDGPYLDTIVGAWLRGVISYAEGYTQRSFMARTWRLTLDRFPDGAIKLEFPPLMSVSSIKYLDQDGVQRTVDPADYIVDTVSEPGYVVPAFGRAWPTTAPRINSVEVLFRCGYGSQPEDLPDDIRLYILAKLQEQFDPVAQPEKDTVQSSFIDNLLFQHRIF
jgi:uncharacterized phiE125 gp8 family phage protein